MSDQKGFALACRFGFRVNPFPDLHRDVDAGSVGHGPGQCDGRLGSELGRRQDTVVLREYGSFRGRSLEPAYRVVKNNIGL